MSHLIMYSHSTICQLHQCMKTYRVITCIYKYKYTSVYIYIIFEIYIYIHWYICTMPSPYYTRCLYLLPGPHPSLHLWGPKIPWNFWGSFNFQLTLPTLRRYLLTASPKSTYLLINLFPFPTTLLKQKKHLQNSFKHQQSSNKIS